MATRKARTVKLTAPNGRSGPTIPPSPVPPEDPDDSDRGLPASPISAGEQDNLMGLMATLAGAATATVTIYRVIKNRPLAYVFECSPDSFSMDQLRDEYGGGEFRVYIHVDGQLQKNIRVMVEPKPRGPDADSPAIAALREGLDKQGKLLEALAMRAAAPAPPPASLGSLLGGSNLPEVITAIGALLQVIRPPAPPPPPAPSADVNVGLDMLMKGIQLAKDLRDDSGGGGESTLLDVVRDMLKSPMLLQAVESASNQPKPGQPALPRPGVPGQQRRPPGIHGPITASARQPQPMAAPPAPPAPDASEVVETGAEVSHAKLPDDQMAQMVRHYMGVLTAQAAADSDPELYAGLILDQLPDDAIIALLEREPDPVSALLADYPPAEPYREWFEAVVAYVEQAFAEDPPSGVQLEGSGHVEGEGNATGSGETLPLG